jgi:hypothetical protein
LRPQAAKEARGMSRKHYDNKGRIEGPFIPVLKETWQCPAWRAMSLSARVLHIALKGRYSFKLRNNGRIYLSVRQAAKELSLNKSTALKHSASSSIIASLP